MSEGQQESHFEGLGSLIRFTGAQVPARARFIGETILSATLSALTFGLVCGSVGATVPSVGPLVPFLWGSWTGYTFGLLRQWETAKRQAVLYCKNYPSLMAACLQTEWDLIVPDTVNKSMSSDEDDGKETLDDWVISGGLGRVSTSILAAQSCQEAVEEIRHRKRQRFVEEYAPEL